MSSLYLHVIFVWAEMYALSCKDVGLESKLEFESGRTWVHFSGDLTRDIYLIALWTESLLGFESLWLGKLDFFKYYSS